MWCDNEYFKCNFIDKRVSSKEPVGKIWAVSLGYSRGKEGVATGHEDLCRLLVKNGAVVKCA